MESSDNKKRHIKKHAGPKHDRKIKRKNEEQTLTKQRNPKAFAHHSVNKVARAVRRTLDIQAKKYVTPVVDRSPAVPAPIIVAIVGPPKVGKTTLLKSLIKNYSRQKLSSISGPVTLVSGKTKRITFFECPNDINSMVDMAKVADLVLLLVDASFGFEMEIFEFLNICQTHGFPKIMGVLTHLDCLKQNKQLAKLKKRLKHRFWTEVYQGAKLFYLTGLVNDEYRKHEVHNLARFISVMKFRPLQWKTSHPFLLVDRLEDMTNSEDVKRNSKINRSLCFYGYVHGTHLRNCSEVHIPGCGDLQINNVSFLSDPCPLPSEEKKRLLYENEKPIYSPFSGVGGIVYDKDAVYIDLGGSQQGIRQSKSSKKTIDKTPEIKRIESMITPLDKKMEQSGLMLFKGSLPILPKDMTDENSTENIRERRLVVSPNDSDDDFSTSEDDELNDSDASSLTDNDVSPLESRNNVGHSDTWRKHLQRAAKNFMHNQCDSAKLKEIIYGDKQSIETNVHDDIEKGPQKSLAGGLFVKKDVNLSERLDDLDISLSYNFSGDDAIVNLDVNPDDIIDCFVTGKWSKSTDADALLHIDDLDDYGEDDDEISDSSTVPEDSDDDTEKSEQIKDSGDQIIQKSKKKTAEDRAKEQQEKRVAKKRRLKEIFDAHYDAAIGKGGKYRERSNENGKKLEYIDEVKEQFNQQAVLNRETLESLSEEARCELEGYRPGLYVRVEIKDVPAELINNFNPSYPLIIGGLLSTEQNVGYVQARIKRHRWFKRILKTRDPVIMSLGWRRFQSICVYSMLGDNLRQRMIKYTPEHLHCYSTFWGPSTPPGTGVLAYQQASDERINFRICATGVITEMNKSSEIVKKLKLVGYPFKIYKKTAFIKDMFTSSLEVAKFEAAILKTVSGIRGQIKKAEKMPAGAFRATFEDKILLSDIVFVRTWYQIDVPKFYTPLTDLLQYEIDENSGEKKPWQGMKTVGQLRAEKNILVPSNVDSLYQPVDREGRLFNPLVIPKTLQKELPFKYKPKVVNREKDIIAASRPAVILEPKERKTNQLMKQLRTLHNHRLRQNQFHMKQKVSEFKRKRDMEDNKSMLKEKVAKKRLYKALGQLS